MAAGGHVIAVKVLSDSGSGQVADVAKGITYAANQGAKIMNLSMTFVPTSQLISAINTAAAKGSLIVFAGGNDGSIFQGGTTVRGLTDQAIQNLVLVGSVNANKTASYFTTKPGSTGGFISTSGKSYSYASRWVMADGEGLYGASNYSAGGVYNYATIMSGTSMAAPLATGVAGLLATRWPVLLKNNTLGTVLLTTATDLGLGGVDATYGNGLLNATNAFNPIGVMTVPVNGQYIPVAQAQLQAQGKVNAGAIQAVLAKGVAYDAYQRDYAANLSTPVNNTSTTNVTVSVYSRSAGSSTGRSFTELDNGEWMTTSFGAAPSARDSYISPANGFTQDPTRATSPEFATGFYSQGVYMGGGRGSGANYSFNEARWGGHSQNAFFDSDMTGAGALLGLNGGAGFAAGGFDISGNERVSFSITMGRDDVRTMLMGNEVASRGMAVGYTLKASDKLDLSFTGSFLSEKNALLGAPSAGWLRIGESASTMAAGFSANYNAGGGLQFGFDAVLASTNPGKNANSLIANTSRLYSASFGVAMRKENLTGVKDTLVASIRSPLHVIKGSANINVPVGADEEGNPVFSQEKVGLATTGMEMDFSVGYSRPLDENTKANVAFEFRNDADNVAGARDAAVMFRIAKTF
jgi:hypothetical protein